MRIWIVNYYTSSPELATNPRYLKFAKYFQEAGHEVITFNSSVKHGTNITIIPDNSTFYKKTYGEYEFVHVKSPHYRGNGVKRMWSIFLFALRLYLGRNRFPKPDIILHNIHTPFDYPIVWIAKSLNAKYIAEAWDLWPEDFVRFGLVSKSNLFLKLSYWIEKRLYYQADELVFTFMGIYDYLDNKGWTTDHGGKIDKIHVHYVNNGIDLKEFDNDCLSHSRQDEDLSDSSTKKIIYIGSIRKANHIKTLIDAANLLKEKSDYRFFIYGDGEDRSTLEHYVMSRRIDNVTFKEKRIAFSECAWVVSQAYINIINYQKGFGYLGISSGKLMQYLAAGKPILCNINIAYDNVIQDNNLGFAQDLSTPEEFAREIVRLAEQPKNDYLEMCRRVRATASQFEYNTLAKHELSIIESVWKR